MNVSQRSKRNNVEYLIQYAMSFLGKPYIYTGNNPVVGFDCSGLISEVLRSAGKVRWNEDLNAQMIYDKFSAETGMTWNVIQPGALAFYGKDFTRITHVGMFIDSRGRIIEAGGGDSTTTTVEKAGLRNAFVRIRMYDYRSDYLGSLKPVYGRIGAL